MYQTRRVLFFGGLFLVFTGMISYFVFAQEGTITGRITDSTRGVVPGVTVTAIHMEMGSMVTSRTNQEGYYVFSFLQSGHYQLSAEMSGFRRIVRSGIKLDVQQVLRIDFALEVGELTQEVSVEASAPLLDASTSSLGQVIDSKKIAELPLLGRNPYALVGLVPGARPPISLNNLPADMASQAHVSINGSRGYQNDYLLDGASNTNPTLGGPLIFPSVDAVQEFRVTTNNYSAEYGRAAGGVFNVVTKSGANALHASLYEFLRNDALTANNFFSNKNGQPKAPFRFNQYGFTVGGPVVLPRLYRGQNRTFFFANYEGVRQQQGVTFVGTVPTDLQRQGDFSQTRNARGELIRIFDPLTTRPDPNRPGQFLRDPFPDNRIPADRIDPVARALVDFFPRPNTPGQPITGVDNFITSAPLRITKDNATVRLDHRVSERQQLYGRWSFDNTPQSVVNVYGNVGSPTVRSFDWRGRGVVLDDSYTFSPTLVASFKYGLSRVTNQAVSWGYPYDLTQLGFAPSYGRALQFPSLPFIQIPGYGGRTPLPTLGAVGQAIGTAFFIRYGLDTHTWQGSLTQTRGRHTIKLGLEVRLLRNNQTQQGARDQTFMFTSDFTQGPNLTTPTGGSALASFLLGTAARGNATLIPGVAMQNIYYAPYVQDDWKLTPRLTLNLGLRYEYESPRTERFNQLANFDAAARPPLEAPGLDLRGGLTFVGVQGRPRGQWEPNRKNFGPRFGFAYSLTPRTVLRGGFGLFYTPAFTAVGTGPSPFGLSGFAATTNFVGTLDGLKPENFLRDPYPQGLNRPTGNRLGLGTLLGQSVAFVDRARKTPYSEQWNLNVQRELLGGILLEVAYVGSRGMKLYTHQRQFNQLPDEALALGDRLRDQVPNPFFGQILTGTLSRPTITRGQLLRPYPHFDEVQAALSTWGASVYHAGQIKVERRFARGFSLLASYTVSKLLDDVTGNFFGEALSSLVSGQDQFQNWNNLRAERSVSALDTPQRFVAGYIWELPFGAGRRYLASGRANWVLGGWQMEGITTFASGNVLGVTSASNPLSQFGVPNLRPNWDGRNPALSRPSVDGWFDTSVFSSSLPYTFGTSPRTIPSLRGHGTKNFDFSLMKNTRVGDRINVQFRAEFFNLFNTPRFDLPNTQFGTSNFGVVSNQINLPRIVQFGLKLIY